MDAPQRDRCKACNAEIVWCQTESGGRMPVDAEPAGGGNIEIRGLTAIVLNKSQRSMADGIVPLHKSHFATCPSASRFRKGRK